MLAQTTINPRLISLKDLQIYTGLGKLQADRLGQAAGAKKRQGRRVLYDIKRIDQHINTM